MKQIACWRKKLFGSQGTVLGPILFNIYVNELSNLPSDGLTLASADDTVIIYKQDTWKN